MPGPGGSILNAMMAIANGLCRHVLCFRTVWQTTAGQLQLGGMPGRPLGDMQWRMPFGATSAANWIGMNASQYLHRYGATRELFGHVAVNARRNAGLNPNAIYRDPLTLDDYFDARMVTTPFGLYDCDVPCDGAMAVIVSAVDVADDLPHPAIRIEAAGTQITERLSWDQDTRHARAAGHRTVDAPVDAHVADARRRRRRPALRRLHVQLHHVDRGARLLRVR